jgi:hypothetical protein
MLVMFIAIDPAELGLASNFLVGSDDPRIRGGVQTPLTPTPGGPNRILGKKSPLSWGLRFFPFSCLPAVRRTPVEGISAS